MATASRRRRPCLRTAAGLSCCSRPAFAMAMIVACALLVAGCGAAIPTQHRTARHSAGTSTRPQQQAQQATAQQVRAQQVMAEVCAAVLERRHTSYDALLGTDPGFAGRAQQLWANLARLPLTRLRFAVATPGPAGSADTRALGANALVASATLSWRLRGQPEDASAEVRVLFTGAGADLRWAGVSEDASASGPLWWSTAVSVATPPPGTAHPAVVLSGRGAPAPAGGWAAVAQRAVRQAATHAPPRSSPAEPVVFEVPADAAAFARATGQPVGGRSDLAAVTVDQAPSGRSGPPVIVINPQAAHTAGLAFVLTHESVHALWNSPATDAPMWLEEGFADAVAATAHPAATREDDRRLRADVRAHGAPHTFPADADFRPDAADLDTTYALARSICLFIVDRWGWPAMTSVMTRVAADPSASWWTVLHASSRAEVEQQWSSWLAHAAGRP